MPLNRNVKPTWPRIKLSVVNNCRLASSALLERVTLICCRVASHLEMLLFLELVPRYPILALPQDKPTVGPELPPVRFLCAICSKMIHWKSMYWPVMFVTIISFCAHKCWQLARYKIFCQSSFFPVQECLMTCYSVSFCRCLNEKPHFSPIQIHLLFYHRPSTTAPLQRFHLASGHWSDSRLLDHSWSCLPYPFETLLHVYDKPAILQQYFLLL